METRKKKVSPVLFTFFLSVVTFQLRLQSTMTYISDTLFNGSCVTFLFLPHFDVISDLLPNRRRATWNLFGCFFSSLTQVRPKKYFLEEMMITFKPVGQRENCNNIFILFFMYNVTPLVKTDISRIFSHLLKSVRLSTILKKKEERKHKGKGMKIQEVCFFN